MRLDNPGGSAQYRVFSLEARLNVTRINLGRTGVAFDLYQRQHSGHAVVGRRVSADVYRDRDSVTVTVPAARPGGVGGLMVTDRTCTMLQLQVEA